MNSIITGWLSMSAATRLSGFFCTGAAARVSGLDEDPSLVDVGVGMDPDLFGQGRGAAFARTVLEFLAREYPGRSLRAVVQSWNGRSLRLTRRLGFVDVVS
jgi:[ribosomal protein S18]-alanine N-acetyltransferase